MGSYSDWITSRRELYKTAITNAYAAHQASSGNDYETGYDSMAAVSEIAALIPPTNATAFYGGSPNATESQINILQSWLQANPTPAGQLNLPSESDASSAAGRKSLGVSGNVGSEKRKWKGNPLYTFANGVLIGKNSKIIAAIGTDGGTSIDGFGTDTLMYFDGIPFSKGTGLPGTAVFAGDVVVSGSIQGTNGIVIIDDVIQLERGFANPAGIGVDDTGKIRLRHRGEGFLDLVDEIETAKSGSIDDAKLWVGAQNTSSARWGSSLIPNSNFASIENSGFGDSYAERPAGIISIGSSSNIISYTSGIVSFNPNAQGIAFQAIPITADRYTVRIRYKGSANEPINASNTAEGLFLGFHETTDEDIGEKLYIYNNSTPAANHEGSSVYSANTTVTYPTSLRSVDSSTYDGAPITTSYVVKSYIYSPSATAKNTSLVVWARNFDLSGTPLLDIDYVVMTEAPQTSTEITSLITTATSALDSETGSDITDAQMSDKSKWAAIGGGSLVDNPNGGDDGAGDAAIEVTCSSSGDGITSTAIDCVSDTYLVGMRIKTSSGTTNISIAGIETVGPYYSTFGAVAPKLVPGAENYRTKAVTIQEVDGDDSSATYGKPIGSAGASKSVTTVYKTFIGTYQPNKLNPASFATGYTTPTDGSGLPFVLPGKFSLAIRADSAVTFLVDYVYAAVQGSSVNVAQELANSAYGDSQTFVTSINDLLIKESGSIVNNSSMAMPSTASSGPAGYRCRAGASGAATISTQTAASGDKSARVVASSGQRTLISPTFLMDSADKYSIGISAKSLASTVNIKVKVAYTTTELTGTNAEYATIATSKQSADTDILTSGVTETSALIIDPDDDQGGSDTTDWNVGTSYENILVTWTAVANQKTGAIIIEADGDFEVDYILVKEQVVSFSLADTQAQTRRNEAIAQAEGFTTALGETISAESGSMIQNASFGSWYLNASNKHRPQGWFTTRGASNPLRVIPATESTDATTQAKENVENVNQQSSAIKFTPSAAGGILSKFIQLPAGSTWTNPADNSVTTTTGTYTFAVRVRLSSAEPIGIRLYAHEYYSYVDGVQTHVIGNASNTYGTATYESSSQIKLFTSSEGQVNRIGPINVTTNDTTPGYNPDGGDYSASGDDQYVEYIPVDNSETDGDIDAVASNYATWYTIAGSYTPHASTKQVSFEILVDGDPDASDGNIPNVYIDYVNLVPQPFDADFAETLADARTQSITGINADGTFAVGGILSTLENNLGAESDSLMPNGNFAQKFTVSSVDYVKNWLPTGNSAAEKLRLQSADSGSKSIGTYIKFDKNASGGSAPYGNNISGIISKAIMNPVETVRDLDGNLNAFNIGMRIRGTTVIPSIVYTVGSESYSYRTGTRDNSTDSRDHYNNFGTAGTGTMTFDIGSVSETTNVGQYVDTSISGNSYGHEDGFIAAQNYGMIFPTSFANQSSVMVIFAMCSLGSDSSRYINVMPRDGGSNITSGYSTSWWISTDRGASWVKKVTEDSSLPYRYNISNHLYDSGSFNKDYLIAVLFQVNPGSDTAVFSAGGHADSIRVYPSSTTGNTTFSKGVYERRWPKNSSSQLQPDFSLKIIAHETYEAIADPNIIVRGPAASLDSTPHASVGITVPAAFTVGGSDPTGASTALNLIDLRYSASTASTEITIDASVVDDDSGEAITDWRHVVGSYTPNEATTGVSFEILVDHEKDGDSLVQEVWLDSITMAVSSVGSDLASTIADNRVFVEQNFQGGTTPVSPNNVIKNGDMSQVKQVIYSGANLKVPLGFTYTTDKSSFSWGDNEFLISPASTITNRATRIAMTNGVDSSNGDKNGIATSPFRITHSKYKIRLMMNATGSYNGEWGVVAICTNNSLSTAASVIKDTADGNSPDYWWTDGVSDSSQIAKGGTFSRQEFYVDRTSITTSITVYEFEWTPRVSHPSLGRPTNADMPEYASLHFFISDLDGSTPSAVDIWEFSAEPTGQPYPSADMVGIQYTMGADFDTEDDLLPAAPRETEAKVAQLKAIDVELSAETSGAGYTAAKDCLVMAMPRKYYNTNSGTTVSGKSYIAPGVSDLKYEQDGTYSVNDTTVGSRKLIFPYTGRNQIQNIQAIRFSQSAWDDVNNSNGYGFEIRRESGKYLRFATGKGSTNDDKNWIDHKFLVTSGTQAVWMCERSDQDLYMSAYSATLEVDTSCGFGPWSIDDGTGTAERRMYFNVGSSTAHNNSGYWEGYLRDTHGSSAISFTGQHRNVPHDESLLENHDGLIVSSTGQYDNLLPGNQDNTPMINESLPIVELTTKRNQKSVWGVISDKEDYNDDGPTRKRVYENGSWGSLCKVKEGDSDRLIINSIGEGAIWVCNINGNLENGDYITTCEIPGYGMLQDDDILHNYTVAKITQDCMFELDNPLYDCIEFEHEGNTYRKAFVGCTYHCG